MKLVSFSSFCEVIKIQRDLIRSSAGPASVTDEEMLGLLIEEAGIAVLPADGDGMIVADKNGVVPMI